LNRDVDQPFKYLATCWSRMEQGRPQVTSGRPTGMVGEPAQRQFRRRPKGNCQSVVNPVLDVSKYQPPLNSPSNTAISRIARG